MMYLKKQLLLFLMMLLPMVASAHDLAVQNGDGVTIYYNYTNDGTELEVTFRGAKYDTYSTEYTGNVVIPEDVTYMNRTRRVTSIGSDAFRGCSSLTSITIPNSVTSIGSDAFWECIKLKKVIVSEIVAWCGIKFANIYANPLVFGNPYIDDNTIIKDLVIPNSVTNIGDYAFINCFPLTSITIPSSVTNIGDYAFRNCGLTSITIPNSVMSIGHWAFSGCSDLISLTIGSGVTSIGEGAFEEADIPTVISLIENPFAIYGKSSDKKTFSLNTFNNATLYVPKGTIDKYKATDGWKDFLFIEEGAPSSVETAKFTSARAAKEHYTIDGKRINEPQKGVNIIRMKDGTTKKVVIK